MTRNDRDRSRSRDDRGASLILAIVFLFVIGLVIAAITSYASTATVNAGNLRSQRDAEVSAENLASEAISLARFDPTQCESGSANQLPLSSKQVYCSYPASELGSGSRTVDFYACPSDPGSACSSSGAVTLHAVVVYDDTPPNQTSSSAVKCGSSSLNRSTCGIFVTIKAWDVVTADT